MKRNTLTALLLISSTLLFSQSIQEDRAISTLNAHQVRAILKDHAELEMRRGQARVDSTAYQAMFRAYLFKDSAYQAMSRAQEATHESAQAYAELYHNADKLLNTTKKEVRRQKTLKIVAFAVAGLALIFR